MQETLSDINPIRGQMHPVIIPAKCKFYMFFSF